MKNWPITGFADEVSPDLDTQIAVLKRLGLDGLDLRGIDGVNVLSLSDFVLDDLIARTAEAKLPVQCVCSPVNKVHFSPDTRRAELAKTHRAVEIAHRLGVKRIRIFTPEVPRGQDEAMWPEVRAWMKDQIAVAKDGDVMLIHENDGRYYGAHPENAKRLFGELGGPHFQAVFDFANTVLIGYRAMDHWFPWILPYLDTLHMKDAIEEGSKIVPSGEGDGQILETFRFLSEQGWSGPLTLEPHLSAAGAMGGYSGEQLFEVATQALRRVLSTAGGQA